jgi:predicted nucleic acid-binding protein
VARPRQPRRLRGRRLADAVVLDSGAVSKAAAGDVRVRAELAVAEQLGADVHVSSVTLAEVLRGHPRDARVHALLAGVNQDPVSPELGRVAGELLGRTKRDDTVDAIVAVTADGAGSSVRLLTGDPVDLGALTTDMAGVTVVPI